MDLSLNLEAMCGIAAIYSYHYAAPEADLEELRQIRDSMTARGPDGFGEWVSQDGRIALGHRRLAIIDLSQNGSQPMKSSDENLVISFNGEIYNYRELRSNLEKTGTVFKSNSDTEVLLHLYAQKGKELVHDLRGMFALVIWDHKKKALFAARDPYGIKPLYYADDGWTVRIASQVKALLKSKKVSKIKDPAGIVGFFLTGSAFEPFTMYQEIRMLPAGSFLWVDATGPSLPERYFSIAAVYSKVSENGRTIEPGQIQRRAAQALSESVRYHLVSDVPVGIFLSAGVDSSAILAMASESNRDLQAVTLGFTEFEEDFRNELPLARKTANRYGVRHHTKILSHTEFKKETNRFFESMDQPTVDGINAYFVSLAAKEMGLKVALSGLGGDELFGGYPSFSDIPKATDALALASRIPFIGRIWRSVYQMLGPVFDFSHPKFSGLMEFGGSYQGAYFLRRGIFMPWELRYMLEEELVRDGLERLNLQKRLAEILKPDPKTPFGRVAALESSFYMRNQLLKDADWAGMAHSLEIRVPLVDAQLLETLAPMSAGFNRQGAGKALLANSLSDSLPQEIAERKKTGFSVPLDRWLHEEEIDHWRQIPKLSKPHCHWSRRWVYTVYKRAIE